ncbi:MAG TPA: protein kinase, partial [Vicinamibacterales bacterium]|nr:protein kinase [Vicinamibacterales bacterium]
MSLSAGTRLGPYEIVTALGAGGMGEVYRAHDTKLGRDVALKILPDTFTHDAGRLARFRREAQVLASLNHPRIGAIYGVDEANGTQFLVLELVDGETVADRIGRGPLPIEEALAIARQTAEALEAAHGKGIVHRDLKPANIGLTREAHVKVLDFGLAKPAESGNPAGITNSPTITSPALMTGAGMLLGTAAYMAPEQAKGREADKRSDIWAFGCVLYEMLTGRRAFEGEDVTETLAFILTKEPDWSALPARTPAPVRRLLRRALQKDYTRRLESAADSRLEIDDALASGTVDAGTPTRRSVAVPWMAAVAAALVLGALAGAWLVAQFRPARADERVLSVEIEPPPSGRFVLGGTVVGDFAISPDGKTVAYTASANGTTGLWVRPLNGPSARLLPGTEYAGQPFWSPDSRSIAFITLGTILHRVRLDGGTPQPICSGYSMRSGSWGSDDYILFSALIGAKSAVFRVAASGGTPSVVAAPDESRGEATYRWPQSLPDGRFLYSVEGNKPDLVGVYAASLSKPAERVKLLTTESKPAYTSAPGDKGYLLWTRDGTVLAQELNPHTLQFAGDAQTIAQPLNGTSESEMHVAASANGLLLYGAFREVAQFAWVDGTGKPIRNIGAPMRDVRMFRLSPDERKIAVQRSTNGISDLWLVDAERGVLTKFTTGA